MSFKYMAKGSSTFSPMRKAVVGEVGVRVASFFFSSRRRHTIFDCDWSSDVCSSDLEEGLLVREVRARRVAEGDTDPTVTALELLADREIGRIRKPPERPEARVQHLGERLRALDRKRAEGVRPDVLPPILPLGRELPHALAAGDGEEGDGVVHVVPGVVGEAEALAVRLPRELEARELPTRGVEDDHRVAGGARPVPAVHTVGPQQALGDGVVLEPLDGLVELQRFRVAAGEEPLGAPAQGPVLTWRER